MEILLTVLGLVLLVFGAEVLVRGATEIALRARISPLVVGLTVVALGTSLPELLVSLLAAWKGNPELAIGNVLGSNIVNLSFILGASILIFPIAVERDARRIHWPVMMAGTVLFMALVWNDRFTRWEGLLFVLLLVLYVVWQIRASRLVQALEGAPTPLSTAPAWRSVAFVLVGIGALALGADWFVEGAVVLAGKLGVSDQLVGVTIVAIGTSLPELITSLMAAFRKQPDISLGNLIGSNIFNLLGILGLTAMVRPIMVEHSSFLLDMGTMALVSFLLFPLMLGSKLGRWQGAVLCVAYFAYIILVVQRG
jgi:cation:H+ antiporter